MKSLQKYPSLHYKQSLITDGRIILLDELLAPEVQQELKSLKTSDGYELLFLEDTQLAVGLEEILKGIVEKEPDTLLVFPGKGSNYPRRLSRVCKEFPTTTGVYAKRFWMPGTDPVVITETICPDIFMITTVKTVVVIDDVISSGLTMCKLHQQNALRFPAAKWVGVAWMAQITQVRAKSGVKGYDYVSVTCVVGKTNQGRTPVNSLSTLRHDSTIAESYARGILRAVGVSSSH